MDPFDKTIRIDITTAVIIMIGFIAIVVLYEVLCMLEYLKKILNELTFTDLPFHCVTYLLRPFFEVFSAESLWARLK